MNSGWQIYRPVALLAAAMMAGLIIALLDDGPADIISWFAIGAPLVWACIAAQRFNHRGT